MHATWQGRRVGEMHEVALAASTESGLGDVAGVWDLVGLGAKGAWPSNVERDFHRKQARSSWLPHLMTVEVPIRTKRGKTKRMAWKVLPPHALFAAILNNNRKDALVDDDCCLDDWWAAAVQCGNEGLNNHPALHLPQHDLRKLSQCIPIKTYGAPTLLGQPDFELPRSTVPKRQSAPHPQINSPQPRLKDEGPWLRKKQLVVMQWSGIAHKPCLALRQMHAAFSDPHVANCEPHDFWQLAASDKQLF